MVHSWLHNGVRYAVTSWLSLTNNNGTYYFGEASLGAATDIVAAGSGNVNSIKKRPAATGLFFGFGDGRSTTTMFIVSVSYFRG